MPDKDPWWVLPTVVVAFLAIPTGITLFIETGNILWFIPTALAVLFLAGG